jgi:hypothetical protein
MPTSSISFSPCAGVSSTLTPSASSASALGHGDAGRGGQDRVGRADVEGVEAAARAAHVGQHPRDLRVDLHAVGTHRAHDRGHLADRRPLHHERDEEARDLHVRDDVVSHVLDELGDLVGAELLSPGQLAERFLEHEQRPPWAGRMRNRARAERTGRAADAHPRAACCISAHRIAAWPPFRSFAAAGTGSGDACRTSGSMRSWSSAAG